MGALSMKKFSLLLLDANVVIVLCKVGLWGHVLEKCEILLSKPSGPLPVRV